MVLELIRRKTGGIWGQNPKIFKPGQIIYQNEALAHLITKMIISREPEVNLPEIRRCLGSIQGEALGRVVSEVPRQKAGPQNASSEARG